MPKSKHIDELEQVMAARQRSALQAQTPQGDFDAEQEAMLDKLCEQAIQELINERQAALLALQADTLDKAAVAQAPEAGQTLAAMQQQQQAPPQMPPGAPSQAAPQMPQAAPQQQAPQQQMPMPMPGQVPRPV